MAILMAIAWFLLDVGNYLGGDVISKNSWLWHIRVPAVIKHAPTADCSVRTEYFFLEDSDSNVAGLTCVGFGPTEAAARNLRKHLAQTGCDFIGYNHCISNKVWVVDFDVTELTPNNQYLLRIWATWSHNIQVKEP
jgi:hypothetical protein